MSRRALLDVNLLIALFDPDHIHHELAHDWFADNRQAGWATCPLTENGFVRVLANPAYGGTAAGIDDLLTRLQTFCASSDHEFWSDRVSLRDRSLFAPISLGGHRRVTDIYLLGLAQQHGGRLATFDRAIPVRAVVGATGDTLAVILSD